MADQTAFIVSVNRLAATPETNDEVPVNHVAMEEETNQNTIPLNYSRVALEQDDQQVLIDNPTVISESKRFGKNLLCLIVKVTQRVCHYQHALSVIERAAQHSKVIEETIFPPPVSRERLDVMLSLIEQAQAINQIEVTTYSEMLSHNELLKKMCTKLDEEVEEIFYMLSGEIWNARGCVHSRLKDMGELSTIPDSAASTFRPFNENFQTMVEDLNKTLVKTELNKLRSEALGELNKALTHLSRFLKARLDDELKIISDSGYDRKRGYQFELISEHEIRHMKALLSKGFRATTLMIGSVPNVTRHKMLLTEAINAGHLVSHALKASKGKESPATAKRVASYSVYVLVKSEDPSFLLVPEAPELQIRKRLSF